MDNLSARALLRVLVITSVVCCCSEFAVAQQPPILTPGQTPPSKQTEPGTAAGQPESTPPPAPSAPAVSTPLIDFESHGLHYLAMTKNGITVSFAALPPHIKEYNVVQVTITNGSLVSWTVKAEDLEFDRHDGVVLPPSSADQVVATLLDKAGRNDVIKLQLLYESSIYALSNYRSTNGYEQRREAAMAQFVNVRFKAAAEASAILLVTTKLRPGDSTDGAVFFKNATKDKTLGAGRLVVHACGETFDFDILPELKSK